MKTKDKVLEAALELFIDHGYHGTSIKLIVEKSGVSTGSVYHHFFNKEDIIKELYAVTKKHMNQHILDKVDFSMSMRNVLYRYWQARINYTMTFPLKAKFISTYFNAPLVQSAVLLDINAMYDPLQNQIKQGMKNQDIIELDMVFFFYDLFNACDAVTLYFETMTSGPDKGLIEMAFKKYWRSIVKLDI